MVQRDAEHVPLGAGAEQGGADRDLGGQVEGVRPGGGGLGVQPVRRHLPRGEGESGLGGPEDPLVGVAVQVGEDRAQRLVAGQHVAEGGAQRGGVQRSVDPQRTRDGVGRARALQAVQEPESGLRGGQRQPGGPRPRGRAGAARGGGAEPGREGAGAASLEEVPDGGLDAERGADPADHPGGEQRVAAEVEEVVVGADLRQA